MRYLVLAGVFTLVVNAASLILFPAAVVGSQGILFPLLAVRHRTHRCRLRGKHFSCFAVFALAGLLMALLPAAVFRRLSLFARFFGSHLAFGSARQQLCRAPVADRDLCCKRS